MEEDLNKKGWHLTPEGQEQCVMEEGDKRMTADLIIKKALNLDLRAIGRKWLSIDVGSGRINGEYIEGPAVLQVLKLRNLSAPKDNEESQAAPRLWKITLTDGQASVAAVCLQQLKNLSLVTPPGTKVLLEGRVDIKSGYLLLTNKNARLLGGQVPHLVESWQLKRKLAQQSRLGIQSEGGPPPFTPFGKKVSRTEAPRRDDDFKSLGAGGGQTGEEDENTEFQQQRQATIAQAEALTARPKTFGGGHKAAVKDSDLARIVEMGFTADQALSALRQSGGDVTQAIGKLLGGHCDRRADQEYGRGRGGGGGGRGAFRERGDRGEQREEMDRNDRRGRREGGRRGRGGEEEEEDSMSSRPSGPATLFDFLETKIPSKPEKPAGGNKQRPVQQSSSDQYRDQRPQTASGSHLSSQRSGQPPHRGEDTGNKPSFQRSDARERQGAGQSSDRGAVSFDRGQKDPPRNSTQKSDPSFASSNSNTRGRNSRDDGLRHQNVGDENQQRWKNQSLQPADQFDHNRGSNSQRPPHSNRGGRQDKPPNSSSQQNGADLQRPGSDRSHPRSLREHNANMDSNPTGRPQSQTWSGKPEGRGDSQRLQADSGQRANFNQRQRHGRDGPPQPRWRRGQIVLAKYWEDNQCYRARIEALAENGCTAVVTFIDYGNQEEVLCTDIHPLQPVSSQNDRYPAGSSAQGYQFQDPRQFNFPPSYPPAGDMDFDPNCIPKMEFRRGGSAPANRQQQQGNLRRPTQNFYTPPSVKKVG